MTIKMSTAARTAVFSTGLKNAFNTHCLCVYSGTEPASADAALGAAVRLLRISTSGLGTPLAAAHIWACPACQHEERRPVSQLASAGHCEQCNP